MPDAISEDELIEVRPHFVIYTDALGTSDRISEVQSDPQLLRSELTLLHKAFETAIGTLQRFGEIYQDLEVRSLSDNILFRIPLSSADCSEGDAVRIGISIEQMSMIQYLLMVRGFFVRGGAAIGDVSSSESLCIGPALIDAAVIEKTVMYPAIFWKDIPEHFRHLNFDVFRSSMQFPWLVRDNSGRIFFNYLYSGFRFAMGPKVMHPYPDHYSVLPPDQVENIFSGLKAHKRLIITRLGMVHLREKFLWLAFYHNYFCQRYCPEVTKLLIEDRYFAPEPVTFENLNEAE